MKFLNYYIKNPSAPRWTNWRDFVAQITGTPQHSVAILSLHFNHFENIKRLLDYLQKEKNQHFDIVLIENSTKVAERKKLSTDAKQFPNCTIITPVSNVGSAGGYALGMEYILSQPYSYFFVVEDDIILQQEGTFSEMMKYADAQTLTFINACENCWTSSHPSDKGKSWWVQIAGYPTSFIEKIGIIDPRNFFRAEDLERGERIEEGINKYHYQTKIVNHNYLHPYLKPINGNYIRFYFSIRNQLFRFAKNSKGKLKLFGVLFFYLRTALDKVLIEGDFGVFKAFCSAIWDFLTNTFSFQHNQKKIKAFFSPKPKARACPIHWAEKSDLSHQTQNLFSADFFLFLTGVDKEQLKYSSKLSHFFTQGVMISANTMILYPLFILAPKVLCINAFDLQTHKIQYIYMHNSSLWGSMWRWVSSILTALVSFLGMSIVIVVIGCKLLVKNRKIYF